MRDCSWHPNLQSQISHLWRAWNLYVNEPLARGGALSFIVYQTDAALFLGHLGGAAEACYNDLDASSPTSAIDLL